MRGADSAVMTGFDRLSYQSRWLQVAPERKFLLWLLLMALAFTLPAWGQALTLALTAALTCWLLRVSFWRWCRWMALPFGFLLVGVLTILFSVSRDPQMLLASLRLGAFSIGISAPGLAVAGETFWRSLAAMAATLWLVLNLPFPQLIILLKRGRVPRLLTEQILLTWRFILFCWTRRWRFTARKPCVLAMVACRRAIARWRCWWDCCSPASSCAISR